MVERILELIQTVPSLLGDISISAYFISWDFLLLA